jgi:hypothetical protein
MSNKINSDWANFSNVGNSSHSSTIPIQALPSKYKKKDWRQATIDALEREGLKQIRKNIRFTEYRKMTQGLFSYASDVNHGMSDFDMPWFDSEVRMLREKASIPTYIKHYDFIGIIVNAITSIYSDLDDRYRVESSDEYSTNEYIRQKTELLHKYAQQIFTEELNKMLLMKGIDPNKSDFQSEEEQQQYQQQLQEQTKALTPPEIEEHMAKNFKVLATEWAQNTLDADKKEFNLTHKDREDFISYLLTGRFFRHYRVGYDFYSIESWLPEQTFFSQDADCKYPQDGEFVGRITDVSVSNILNTYGHLMTLVEQEAVGNYWNQTKNWKSYNGAQVERKSGGKPYDGIFPQQAQVPFHNYFDHEVNLKIEDALNFPLGVTTTTDSEGNENSYRSWLPREEQSLDTNSRVYTQYLRDDIDVRTDTVQVTEVYWRSMKRIGILIYRNPQGSTSLEIVTDDLLSDFLREKEIKIQKNISIQELQTALKEERLDDFIDTITYTYVPEVWKGVKIRGNGSTLKNDLYLDVNPLEYQIKGERSNIYDVKLPVSGLIDTGIATLVAPYQQLHNICMNQNTELLEKELGIFFSFDITGLPAEYQDQTTEESLYQMRDDIKSTGLLALDLSRQNTSGNNPNVFQRQEIVYAQQIESRKILAEYYKQQAFGQVGLTPQILGAPTTYETAEGVKQGAQASYALINHRFEKMHTAKAKGMDIQLAVAQYCQVNGKDSTVVMRKSDGDHYFLDILAEDGELFPLRHLGVCATTSTADRKTIEQIKQFVLNDNTVERDMQDVISILTNPVLVDIVEKTKQMKAEKDRKLQEQRAFESEQTDKQIEANAKNLADERAHEIKLQEMTDETKVEVSYIASIGKAADNNSSSQGFDRIQEAAQQSLDNNYKEYDLGLKQQEASRKETNDVASNKIELRKLALKSQELALKSKQIDSQNFTSTINKN